MQAQMYERMLQNQKESAAMAIDAHKSATAAIQSTTDKSMDNMRDVAQASSSEANAGYKEAARISQSVNEKSMDSMSKVATAAAAHSNDGLKEAVQVSRSVNETSIESMAEVYSAALKHAQYKCGNCSHQLQDDDMCCTECGTPRKK
jgi:ribosomal protein L19